METRSRRSELMEKKAEILIDSALYYPREFYTKIIEYLKAADDHETLASVSLCNRALHKLTKSYFEKECHIQIDMKNEEMFVKYKNLMRDYKSFVIVDMSPNKESNFKALMAKYGKYVEKLCFDRGEITSKSFSEIIKTLSSLEALNFRHFDIKAGRSNCFIKADLKILYLIGFKNAKVGIFKECKNLQHLTISSCYRDYDYHGFSYQDLVAHQKSLENFRMDEMVRFSERIEKQVRFQLKSLSFTFIVHKPWHPTILFLNTQTEIEFLSVNALNWHEGDDKPDEYMDEIISFIFRLRSLKHLRFEHDVCDTVKVHKKIFKEAKRNYNLKTLNMKRNIDGLVGDIFNAFLKTCPNIELLAFCVNKFPSESYANINSLRNVSKMYIYRNDDPEFVLSDLIIGNSLKNFSYGGTDLKLIEYEIFFNNHPKLAHVTFYFPKVKNNLADFVQALLVLTELRTLDLHVKDFPEELKDLIRSNLKYLYSFTVQDPKTEPEEDDDTSEIDSNQGDLKNEPEEDAGSFKIDSDQGDSMLY